MSSYSSLLVDIGGTNMRYAYANKKGISEENILSNISDQNINKTLRNLLSNPKIKNAVIAAAGPRLGNRIEMTNRKVTIDADYCVESLSWLILKFLMIGKQLVMLLMK